jgi:hypothetical protein
MTGVMKHILYQLILSLLVKQEKTQFKLKCAVELAVTQLNGLSLSVMFILNLLTLR